MGAEQTIRDNLIEKVLFKQSLKDGEHFSRGRRKRHFMFENVSTHQNHLEGILKHRLLALPSGFPIQQVTGWSENLHL